MRSIQYTTSEMMAACCAHEIRNGDLVFVGVGIPMIAGVVASRTHAKESVIVYEGGGVGAVSRRIPWNVADNPSVENALAVHEMWRLFGDTQAGFINKGIIGGAQVDKYGNINTTVVTGPDGSYLHPKIRLPGSGGANDIASCCEETIILMRLEKGKFVENVDFITSPGHLGGPGQREAAGLLGKGPVSVITDKGIFYFDDVTKEMYLGAVYPGVSVEEIRDIIPWDLKVAEQLPEVPPPTQEEVDMIRRLDPNGFFLGGKSVDKESDFEEFSNTMRRTYRSFSLDL